MSYNSNKQVNELSKKTTVALTDNLIVKGLADIEAKKADFQQYLDLFLSALPEQAGVVLNNTLFISQGISDAKNRIFPTVQNALIWYDANFDINTLGVNNQLTLILTAGVHLGTTVLLDFVNIQGLHGAVIEKLERLNTENEFSTISGVQINELNLNSVTPSAKTNFYDCSIKKVVSSGGGSNSVINFNRCIFSEVVHFSTSYSSVVKIENCKFKNIIDIENLELPLILRNCIFETDYFVIWANSKKYINCIFKVMLLSLYQGSILTNCAIEGNVEGFRNTTLINCAIEGNITSKDNATINMKRACFYTGSKITEGSGVINDEWEDLGG